MSRSCLHSRQRVSDFRMTAQTCRPMAVAARVHAFTAHLPALLFVAMLSAALAAGCAARTEPRVAESASTSNPSASGDSTTSQPDAPSGLAALRRDAAALRPGIETGWVRKFLDQTSTLPAVSERRVYQDPKARTWFSATHVAALPDADKAGLREVKLGEEFYYNTRYGSPLAYARALDLLGRAGLGGDGPRKVLDFGCGGIGQLRLLASLGADVTGVDVDSLLPALYSEPGDQGSIAAIGGGSGRVRIVCGRYPADAPVREAIGGGYDLIISKNTLKNGYIHPAELVEPRMLVELGVNDETFVRALFDALVPGGRVMIYNLCPAQNPPGKPYIPWADGRCPFAKSLWESVGFRVVAFDVDDGPTARHVGHLLGWDQGEGKMDLENGLFAHYSLVEKPASAAGPR